MAPAPLFLALGMLLGLAAQRGEAIRCWSCNSVSNPSCGDPFNNRTFTLRDCNQGRTQYDDQQPKYCSKMKSEVNGQTVYHRSCSHMEGLCPDATVSGMCATCPTDACNAAPGPNRLPAALLAALTGLAVVRLGRH